MKYLALYLLLFFPSIGLAFSCQPPLTPETSISQFKVDGLSIVEQVDTKMDMHLSLASRVFIGRVVSGEINEHITSADIEILKSFKGDVGTSTTITTPEVIYGGVEITLGESYLVFLYSDSTIDSCSVFVGLGSLPIANQLIDDPSLIEELFNSITAQILKRTFEHEP